MKILKRYAFPIFMIIALVVGTLLGLFATDKFVENIAPLGDIFINMMFTLVVPLVFFTITSAIVNMKGRAKLSKILITTIIIFVITSLISAIIALVGVLLVKPSSNVIVEDGEVGTKTSFLQAVADATTTTDFVGLFSKSNMLALIIFSIILGLCLRKVDKENRVGKTLEIFSNALLKFVKIIMYYAPIGVCAFFASLINSFGEEILKSYLRTLLIYLVLTVLYFLIFYSLYAFIAEGKNGVKKFYKHIFRPFATSLATQSSLASLPVNLETSDEMGISQPVSRVALPLGSTIHMEGSAIASIVKIFFLFNVFDMHIGVGSCILAVLIAVASSVVMSGIPGGGLIGEMLIVSLYGFPNSAFTMIATIGWLVDAPATMLNVCGDVSSAMIIDKFAYKNNGKNIEEEITEKNMEEITEHIDE